MADRNMKFNLDFLTKTKGLKDAKKDVDDVADSLDGVDSAAKQAAEAMRQSADKIDADLKETAGLADRLSTALGPEMADKIGRSNLEGISMKLRDVGVSAETSDGDIDLLADGIRELDRVSDQAKTSLGSVDTEMRNLDGSVAQVGKQTDNTRSVMANMVGNAVQELPLVSGALGSVAMAMGQLGEYAAEGNIKFSQLAKFAGPMAAVGIGVSVISNHMEQVAKSKAFHAERVEAFTEALRDGATAAEAWDEALTGDDNKIEFIDAATGDVSNFTDELYRNGVTWEQFKGHLNDSAEDFDTWARSAFGANAEQGDLNAALQTYYQLSEDSKKATQKAAEEAFVFAKATDKSTTSMRHWSDAANEAKLATDRARVASEKLAAMLGTIDDDSALLNLQGQFDDVRQSAEDAWNAGLDAAIAAEDAAKAVAAGSEDAAEKSAAATEAAKRAEEATRSHELSVNDMTLSVAAYGTEVLGLPVEQVTAIIANLTDANLAAVEAKLVFLSRNRQMYVHAGMIADSSLRNLMEGRGSATGTPNFTGGATTWGEQGQEMAILPNGTEILSAGPTRMELDRRDGGGDRYSIVNNIRVDAQQVTSKEQVASAIAFANEQATRRAMMQMRAGRR